MYSKQSDYEQRRPYSGQSRPWDEEAKREEWPEPPRNSVRESYNDYNDNDYDKYNENRNNREESRSSRGHSKTYMRESISYKDWRGKRTASSERTFSEKKRRTFVDEDQRRYQPESEDSYRQSPEHYSHAQRNDDLKRAVSIDEGYSRKRTPEESGRYSQRQDDFHYREYKEDSHYKQPKTEYWDREGPERNWSPDGRHSQDVFEKGYTSQRLSSGSFSRDHEDHNRTMFPLNGSNRQTEPSKRRLSPPPIPPPIPPPPPPPMAREKRMSKGFQRFLNVLNMGVNVETLTKIVNQGSPDVKVRQPSPPPSYTDKPWAVGTQRLQFRPESEQPPRSPPSRTYSSNGKTLSEERFLENRQFERNYLGKRSASPTKKSSSFEDDNKRRQMHDVLQAIGIKLEFEEVGQMSSRIQERLYGKKQIEHVPIRKDEQERKRGAYVPKRRSSSSSESSSGSFKEHRKSHSYSSQKEETDFSYYADTNHPSQRVSPITHVRPNPEFPQAPVIPPHAGFTNPPPVLPPIFIPPIPQYHPTYPPTYPHPGPPFTPMNVNIFQPVAPPNAPVPMPPWCMPHPFLPDLLIPTKHLHVDINAQKTTTNNKNLKRPRCLQVISTKK